MLCFFTDACKDYYCNCKAAGSAEARYNGGYEIIALLNIGERNAENGTVCCYKRKINSERLVKLRNKPFEEKLNKLNKSRYNKNEYNCV